MLLLLARHVDPDLELSFGSSSNQPSPYCSEKRSLHLQLEKRTLLSSLDWSASCERWRFQGSTAHRHSERPYPRTRPIRTKMVAWRRRCGPPQRRRQATVLVRMGLVRGYERPVLVRARPRRRRGFLSDRKYRYHPRTQADVADCWPCETNPDPVSRSDAVCARVNSLGTAIWSRTMFVTLQLRDTDRISWSDAA